MVSSDRQEDSPLQRAQRAAAANGQRNRGHGDVVGGFPGFVTKHRRRWMNRPWYSKARQARRALCVGFIHFIRPS